MSMPPTQPPRQGPGGEEIGNFTLRVRVRVKSAVTESLLLDVQQSDTVSTMMHRIEQRTKIPVQSQRLIHNGRQLESSQVVSKLAQGIPSTLSFVLLQTANMDASVRVCVRTVDNRKLAFAVGVQSTLTNVKQLVQFSYGLQVSDTVVVFEDLVLEEDKSLFDYGITHDSTLYILPLIEFKSANGNPVTECTSGVAAKDQASIAAARHSMYMKMVRGIETDSISDLAQLLRSPPLAECSQSAKVSATAAAQAGRQIKQERKCGKKRKTGTEFGIKRGFFDRARRVKVKADVAMAPEESQGTSVMQGVKAGVNSVKGDSGKPGKKKLKCHKEGCREKLRLTAIECRCRHVFCSQHRHAEAHGCPFDYKELGRNHLSKSLISACAERVAAF
eukprot:TRINITY_DN1690_c0_g1_i1.p1 TRINITY_DN1690_c0_g1~~TRINITY_DN1690_c0_g1_i1.p1  ORF type:complete len:389 (-),score=61.36 TRINITY_DN1690_c0_g1_i1:402-1568(-)